MFVMKKRGLITFVLLFVLGFSIIHEYAFTLLDSDHCTTSEFIAELDAPQNHGDICDIHFEYHQSFLLSSNFELTSVEFSSLSNEINHETYTKTTSQDFIKPPITL